MLQCVAVCCSVLQCGAFVLVSCSVLPVSIIWPLLGCSNSRFCVHVHVRVSTYARARMCVCVYVCASVRGCALVCAHTYRVAKTHRIPYLYRSFSAKEPYI